MPKWAPVIRALGVAFEMKMELALERKGGIFSKDYELMSNGSVICDMRLDDWKLVDFLIEGKRYLIRSEGRGRWTLESSGISVAACERQGTGTRLRFRISFDTRTWLFEPRRKGLTQVHDIWEDDCVVGQIVRKFGWWSSRVHVTFPQMARMEIVSFAIWLIGIHWASTAGILTAARADLGL